MAASFQKTFNQVFFLCNVPSTTAALQAKFYLLATLHNPALTQGQCENMIQEVIGFYSIACLTTIC